MPDWRYVAPGDHEEDKVVNNRTYKFCKHCKCRATGKVGFFTNHSSSEHTFPRNRPSADAVTDDTPSSEAPAGSHSAVEEDIDPEGDNGGDLVWEGFMSPVEDQPDEEATVELIVGHADGGDNDEEDNDEDPEDTDDEVEGPEMGECICGLPGIIGTRCEYYRGQFIPIAGKCGFCRHSVGPTRVPVDSL